MDAKQADVIKDPFDLLVMSLDELIMVKLKNGRRLLGKLHAYDLHLNMVLSNVEETFIDFDRDDDTYEEFLLETKRTVPMLFVRGDGIIVISPQKVVDFN